MCISFDLFTFILKKSFYKIVPATSQAKLAASTGRTQVASSRNASANAALALDAVRWPLNTAPLTPVTREDTTGLESN